MSINKNNTKKYVDGKDNISDLYKSLTEDFALTEENFLNFISAKEKYFSLTDFKKWIRWSLDIQEEENNEWKDFLIRHGYINEKEEIIYKPENK